MGISLGATMTLRERIKAALDGINEPWFDGCQHDVKLIAAARELLPLVLAEMGRMETRTAKIPCVTCGDEATQWDYDQNEDFCDLHVQQADFTVPIHTPEPSKLAILNEQ